MDILEVEAGMYWVDVVKQSLINTPIQQVLHNYVLEECPSTIAQIPVIIELTDTKDMVELPI